MKADIRGIVFDLDGTLVDTVEDIAITMNRTLSYYAYPTHATESFRNWIGGGTVKMVVQAAPKHCDVDAVHQLFLDIYAGQINENPLPYPGIVAVLKSLNNRNTPIAVLTNKHHKLALKLVQHLFFDIEFLAVQGLTEGVPAKPDPASLLQLIHLMAISPSECLIIGDTDIDITTGKNAGCLTMAATWGYQSIKLLEKLEPDYIVHSPFNIVELLHLN